jgi:hypothetical protein
MGADFMLCLPGAVGAIDLGFGALHTVDCGSHVEEICVLFVLMQ